MMVFSWVTVSFRGTIHFHLLPSWDVEDCDCCTNSGSSWSVCNSSISSLGSTGCFSLLLAPLLRGGLGSSSSILWHRLFFRGLVGCLGWCHVECWVVKLGWFQVEVRAPIYTKLTSLSVFYCPFLPLNVWNTMKHHKTPGNQIKWRASWSKHDRTTINMIESWRFITGRNNTALNPTINVFVHRSLS